MSGRDGITSNPELTLSGTETGHTPEYSFSYDGGSTWAAWSGSNAPADGLVQVKVRRQTRTVTWAWLDTVQLYAGHDRPGVGCGRSSDGRGPESFSVTDEGTFSDPGFNDASGDPATSQTFPYAIDWGDNTQADTGTAAIDALGGAGALTYGSFDGSHTYGQSGVYNVAVTVADAAGCQSTRTMQVRADAAPVVSGFCEGRTVAQNGMLDFAPIDFASASFADADPGDSLQTVKITALPTHGQLDLSGSAVVVNQQIAVTDLGNVTYERDGQRSHGFIPLDRIGRGGLRNGRRRCDDFDRTFRIRIY